MLRHYFWDDISALTLVLGIKNDKQYFGFNLECVGMKNYKQYFAFNHECVGIKNYKNIAEEKNMTNTL